MPKKKYDKYDKYDKKYEMSGGYRKKTLEFHTLPLGTSHCIKKYN